MALHHRAQEVRRPGKIESFFTCESLEQRQLLTTLHGGEVFEFFDPNDAGTDRDDRRVIRVSIQGEATIELIGGIVDDRNNLIIADIPGRLLASPLGRDGTFLGGLGGGTGLEAIGPTPIDDPINGAVGTLPVPDDDVAIDALASQDDGDTYAFHILETEDDGTFIQVLQINTLTGDATVIYSIEGDPALPLDDEGASTVTAIPAADFDEDGLLWFVAAGTVGDTEAHRLYTIDVDTGVVTAIPGTFDELEVHGIAFDELGTLHAFVSDDTDGFLVDVSLTNTDTLTNLQIVLEDGEPFADVAGIDIRPGDLTPDGNLAICAITSNGVYRIDRELGSVFLLGDLALPDGPDEGNDDDDVTLTGFAYNPALVDPFTGELGALIATDIESDQLVFVNKAVREGHHIFNIHVTRSTPETVISIAMVVDRDANPPVMQPFNGNVGSFRVVNAQDGQFITVAANENTGQVLLGQRQLDLPETENFDESLIAITDSPFSNLFGTRPPGTDGLRAGLVVTENLLDYLPDRDAVTSMIGLNLDRVVGLAVRNNGQIWVIDDDNINSVGDTIDGDEMALINASTGLASDPIEVTDSLTGDPLSDLQALSWGDPDGDGTERLYAVYPVGGVMTLGIINTNRSGASYGQFTAIGPVDAGTLGVQAMDFLDDRLFMIDNDGDFVEINPADGSLVNLIRETTFEVSSMAFDGDGTLFIHDLVQGRLLDLDLTDGTPGTNTKTRYSTLSGMVGAIAFDPENDRFLAIDNSTGYTLLAGREGESPESSSLMVLRGTERADSEPQDIGRFLLGGTIIGSVDAAGSIGLFYAGWLLTGNAFNSTLLEPDVLQNFKVAGDLRDLVVLDSIGTHDAGPLEQTTFLTGFDMFVGGRLGQIKTYEHFLGSVTVDNNGFDALDGIIQQEIETRGGTTTDATGPLPLPLEVGFENGFLVTDDADDTDTARTTFNNDTFDTPQYLGTINSTIDSDVVQVTGALIAADQDNLRDFVDYYGVALLGGQTVQVQLIDLLSQALGLTGLSTVLAVGVYDPDGRLIASNYSDISAGLIASEVFRFTVERPGVHRFAVGVYGEADFNGAAGEFDLVTIPFAPYELRIRNAGNIALGGLSADDNVFDGRATGTSVMVRNGDLGAVQAGAFHASLSVPLIDQGLLGPAPTIDSAITGATVEVLRGNLRSLRANDIGRLTANIPEFGVEIDVPRGSVGQVQANNVISLNPTAAAFGPPAVSAIDPIGTPREAAIGGDYQLIHAGGRFYGSAMARRGIGLIRAGNMETNAPSFFVANADNTSRDGIIDLIDVFAGNMGTLAGGGPAIITGPGGNVRYIHLNPGNIAFRDLYFGGGTPETTVFDPGAEARLFDDSGTEALVTPTSNFDSITATTYGVRGSGGSAIVSVTSTGGINVRADAAANRAAAEFGTVSSSGEMFFGGTATLDVFDIIGGPFIEIINSTDGEIVGGNISAVQTMSAETIGVARQFTGAAVNGGTAQMTAFPFNDQRIGLVVGGPIGLIQTRREMGNIQAATIGQMVLDSNRSRRRRSFDGIVGPIFATGTIDDVTLGAGIMTSGTGNLSRAGVYANGQIGQVRGHDSVMAGNIVSETGITRIHLTGDSTIVNANVQVANALDMTREFSPVANSDAIPDTLDTPVYDIGEVFVDGPTARRNSVPEAGGLIGSFFNAADIGTIRVRNGFGVINSGFTVPGGGRMADFLIDGYGLRDSIISGGAIVGKIVLTGNGKHLDATRYAATVRQSENVTWNAYTQFPNNKHNDLHRYLGTSADTPRLTTQRITSSGVIAGSTVQASRNLAEVSAFQVRHSDRLTPPEQALPIDVPSRFDVANRIFRFVTRNDVANTEITTGQMDFFEIGRNAVGLDMTVAGLFSRLRILGDLRTNSLIEAIGPDGEIEDIFIGDELDGVIHAERKIGRIRVVDEDNSCGSIMQRNTQVFPAP